MNWFSNMSIFKKIGLIFVLSVIIFAVNLTISIVAINKNNDTMTFMQDKVSQRVELANQNVIYVQRLDELYTQAVSFADEDLIDNANKTFESLKKNINSLTGLDNEQASRLSTLNRELSQYNDITYDLAKGMIDNTLDMSKVGEIIANKTQVYDKLINGVQQYKTDKVSEFNNTIQESVSRSESSLALTLSIGLVLLLIMAIATISIAKSLSGSAGNLANSLGELADGKGDLRHQLDVTGRDELGQVSSNFNRFLRLLADAIQQVVSVTAPLLQSAESLKERMGTATQATEKQSLDAKAVQHSMEEMGISVNEISQSAQQAAEAADSAEQEATNGLAVVASTINISQELNAEIEVASDSINELAKDTESVNSILNVITSIAEQTNLLALNAAIEAARAGEQGRGFAVVADEVRALASKTADATKEIREVLSRLKVAAESSVSTMDVAIGKASDNEKHARETGDVLKSIQEQIVSINTMNTHIAAATEQQSAVAAQVSHNVVEMNASFVQTLDILAEVQDVSEGLLGFSDELQSATSQFKL
ncbi:HAMP domain-containing methyl-accepting chemotaxis protein [Shewanella sp. 1_MG-2023]|uniref:Methyl-accepting chemotaxis protein n=1 Tax=Shewanella electrodiphila TaxID=934143 RepID=A0ABT0KSY0_9GAMM|nr:MULTISPECIES: HAMP domain-containing methyl-accepting chemotaxis protein [Shewanella]MCL1046646.1 methyl-accepting chemotaxis protein [Shewanella electrodiphila]MDO6611134.1 HAMP domain-containing methyl-accepting chemotaxis protein [Shewanella sp. 7_MG-2023]MDO6770989.1 HAMP domain-containing methyl-accepting chemotaxis protein [Shewanella sp. 2_MG-2023]MDO6794624.1 HAMP domain-containing methyl-accepting chemotaxis protein [Shewanella sp. 1_MG-2023]PMG79351.1 chemotaxis protein [Shewanell